MCEHVSAFRVTFMPNANLVECQCTRKIGICYEIDGRLREEFSAATGLNLQRNV